jgi:hypothetical protein
MYKNLASFLFENFEFWQLKISKLLFSDFQLPEEKEENMGNLKKTEEKAENKGI